MVVAAIRPTPALIGRNQNPCLEVLFQSNLEIPHISRSCIRASAKPRVHAVDCLARFDGVVEDIDAFPHLLVYLRV